MNAEIDEVLKDLAVLNRIEFFGYVKSGAGTLESVADHYLQGPSLVVYLREGAKSSKKIAFIARTGQPP
jgi:hypothetical protein